jgi:predicted transcriptional regulator
VFGGDLRLRRRDASVAVLLHMLLVLGWRRVDAANATEHGGRAAILAKVREQPGIHQRALARELDISPQNASYHLRRLETLGLVTSTRPGRQRRYFPVEGGRAQRDAWLVDAFLANARRREMLSEVVHAPGIRAADLARRLGMPHGSAHWGLRRLVERGLVVAEEAGYAPTPEGLAAAHDAPESPGPPTRGVS